MSKILIKNNETYFIDSIYDLHQVVDDDTYDIILNLFKEVEGDCTNCDFYRDDSVERDLENAMSTLEEVYELLNDIRKADVLDEKLDAEVGEMLSDIYFQLS